MLVVVSERTRQNSDPDVAAELSAVIERVAAGDQLAFGELYDRVAPRIHGLVRRLLVDGAQSEEVTQEVFLEIWQNATRYDPKRGGAMTWMMTIAHRRAVDRIRSSQAGRERDEKIGRRDIGVAFDEVSERAEVSIEHAKVTRALETLSHIQREVVQMAYYGGFSHSELANELGVPLGTVKTRLRDGMIRLREELGVSA